jgi:hypothetical protein
VLLAVPISSCLAWSLGLYIWRRVQVFKLLFYTVFSNLLSLLGPNTSIILSTLFSNTLTLYSLNIRHQVSLPYWTTGKFVVLYILIFKY